MTIFRGPGGTGSASSDSDTTEFQEFLVQSQAARDAALAAQVAAELAETNAETAETNAETAETNAETAATNAASSASAAASSASSASTSASNASTSASAASTSATNAASSASSASSSASAASTSASNAATSATSASNSASSASTSATNAANSASTATTQATNAASSATAAASSASSAATSATNAANSASSASTSATNAAASATSAAASASAAAASAASINPADIVHISGTETITGSKTFSSNPTLSGGTANGVAYLNGSKVLTTGSALTFDGTNLGIGTTSPGGRLDIVEGTFANIPRFTRTTSADSIALGTARLKTTTSADMIDGFGTTLIFSIQDNAAVQNDIAQISAVRSGADNTGSLAFGTGTAGSISTKATIDSSGNVGIGTSSLNNGYGVGKSLMLTNQSSVLFQNASNTWNTSTAGGGVTYYSDNNLYLDAKDSASNVIFRVNGATERARIDSSGNVGIGTSSPTAKLDIRAPSAATLLNIQETDSGNGRRIRFLNSGTVNTIESTAGVGSTQLAFSVDGTERVRIDSSGNLQVSNLAGTGNRAVYSTSTGILTNSSSDRSLKENDAPISQGLDAVLAMRPVSFEWVDKDKMGAQREIGFIAQEMQQIVPEVVGSNSDETLSIDYPKLVAVMTKAIQELTDRVKTLEAK